MSMRCKLNMGLAWNYLMKRESGKLYNIKKFKYLIQMLLKILKVHVSKDLI